MKKTSLLLLSFICLLIQAEAQSMKIDLSGTWLFALDREGNIKPDAILTETIQLPGTTDTNKKGDFTVSARSGDSP